MIHFIFLYLICFAQGNKDFLDEKNGYKDIKLGSDITDLADKIKIADGEMSSNELVYYDYTDKSALTINNQVHLKNVTIRAFKGKVLNIFLSVENQDAFELYKVFTEAFGRYSDRPNQFMDKYYWYGKKVELFYNFDSTSNLKLAWFTDIALERERAKGELEKTKKSANDL